MLDLGDDDSRAGTNVERRAAVERAVDAVRDRFGSRSRRPGFAGRRHPGEQSMMRIGLVGLRSHRHRARVRAAAAHRREARRRRAHGDVRRRSGARRARGPASRRRAGRDPGRARCRSRRRVGVHVDRRAPRGGRGRGRRPACPVFCEKPLGPDLAGGRARGRPARAGAAPGRARPAVVTGVPARGRDRCRRRVRPPARHGPARRPVLPDPGLLRIDVAQGRDAGGRRHADRALDPRRRRAALAARRPGVGRARAPPHGSAIPASRTPRR